MKRFFILVAFLIITCAGYAQTSLPKLELRKNGFIGPDSTKNYVVLEYPKVSKVDLYKKTLTYLNSIYKNPGKVISTVEGESITVNGYDNNLSKASGLYRFPYAYNILLQFKEGKIRFEPKIVDFKEIFTVNNKETPFYINSRDSSNPAEIHCIYIYNNEKDITFLFQKDLKEALDKWINNYVTGINAGINDNW